MHVYIVATDIFSALQRCLVYVFCQFWLNTKPHRSKCMAVYLAGIIRIPYIYGLMWILTMVVLLFSAEDGYFAR